MDLRPTRNTLRLTVGAIVGSFLAAITLGGLASSVGAQNGPSQLTIVILDGAELSYPPHYPKPNWQVLSELLPNLLSEFDPAVPPHYVDVMAKDKRNIWVNPSHVIGESPDLVLMHWSAFKAPDQRKDCDPSGSQEQRECAQELLNLMLEVFDGLDRRTRFIIYSRQPNLCLTSFKNALFRMLRHRTELASATGLISMSKTARQEDFMSQEAQADLRALAKKLLDNSGNFQPNNQQGLCLLSSL